MTDRNPPKLTSPDACQAPASKAGLWRSQHLAPSPSAQVRFCLPCSGALTLCITSLLPRTKNRAWAVGAPALLSRPRVPWVQTGCGTRSCHPRTIRRWAQGLRLPRLEGRGHRCRDPEHSPWELLLWALQSVFLSRLRDWGQGAGGKGLGCG